jgi:tetratricopeptide (TPR) repeat protein
MSTALVVLSLLFSLCGRPSGAEFDDLVTQCLSLEQKEDYPGAAAVLEKALAIGPGNYWLHIELADVYVHLGRFEKARAQFRQARGLNSHIAAAYIAEGYTEIEMGRDSAAEKAFSDLIAADTANPVGYHHLGFLLQTHGRHAEAESYLREAMRKFKTYPTAKRRDMLHCLKDLAVILGSQGKLKEAESLLREGVGESSGEPILQADILCNLAHLYMRQGRNDQAESSFLKALSVCRSACPLDSKVDELVELAGFYADREERRQAEAALASAATALNSTNSAHSTMADLLGKLADVYSKLGKFSDAEPIYRRILADRKAMPSNPLRLASECSLAEICARTGRLNEAVDLYEDAIRIVVARGDKDRESDLRRRLDRALGDKASAH